MQKGIDVSDHNKQPDWDKVKADGVKCAMIRMGYGSDIPSQDDAEFERNVHECERVGIHWGAYLYSYALDLDHARSEVEHAKRLLKGKSPTLPIGFDMEDADHYKRDHGVDPEKNKQLFSDICYLWLSEMQKTGYEVRLYANEHWLNNILVDPKLNEFKKWVAQWGSKCTYDGEYDIWQYDDKGRVSGIEGYVDMDWFYGDAIKHIPEPKRLTKAEHISVKVDLIQQGDQGSEVKKYQEKLKTLGYYHGHIDGIFGRKTAAAVRSFQEHEHISQDGIIGPVTRKHLESAKPKPSYPLPNAVLQRGDEGKAVREVQAACNVLDFKCGSIDGIYGSKTEGAVRRFQEVYLPHEIDGIYGPHTEAAMKKELKRRGL